MTARTRKKPTVPNKKLTPEQAAKQKAATERLRSRDVKSRKKAELEALPSTPPADIMDDQEINEYLLSLANNNGEGMEPTEKLLLVQFKEALAKRNQAQQELKKAIQDQRALTDIVQKLTGQVDACATVLTMAEKERRYEKFKEERYGATQGE